MKTPPAKGPLDSSIEESNIFSQLKVGLEFNEGRRDKILFVDENVLSNKKLVETGETG